MNLEYAVASCSFLSFVKLMDAYLRWEMDHKIIIILFLFLIHVGVDNFLGSVKYLN
jgi:hypothetical protein